MSQPSDHNKALTVKFFEQVFNHQNYAIVPDLISPNYTFNGQGAGSGQSAPDMTVVWAKSLETTFPGLHFTIEDILAEDEKVALRWRMDVTDPATGTKGYISGTNILVFDGGGKALSNNQGGGHGRDFVPAPAAAAGRP